MAVLLAPVLGIVARNELYLYLPTFGACLLAAAVAAPWIERLTFTRATLAWLVVCVAGLAAYQASRSAAFQADLVFSERLVRALGETSALRAHRGPLALVGDGPVTQQFLQDAIAGYMPAVARRALGSEAFTRERPTLRLRCTYGGGRVLLEPL